LLGNIVITIVFSSLWPHSAREGVRAAIAEALRAIGAVIRRVPHPDEARLRTVQALVRADHLRTLSLFELRMLPSHAPEHRSVPFLADIERLAGAAFVASTTAIAHSAEPASIARLAEWADSAAENVSRNRPLPPSPGPITSGLATAMQPEARLSLNAIDQLEWEVRRVAAAVH
jgi:multidrug resistance protein MdtO